MERFRDRWGEPADRKYGSRRSPTSSASSARPAGVRRSGRSRSAAAASASSTRSPATPSSPSRKAPQRVAVFGTNNVGPTIAAFGTDEQKVHLVGDPERRRVLVPGLQRTRLRLRPRRPAHPRRHHRRSRRLRRQRPEGVDLDRPATPPTACCSCAPTPTLPSTPASRRCSCRWTHPASPAARSSRSTARPSSPSCSSRTWSCRRSALLGPLHEGWRVTMATLGFERAGVISIAGKLVDDVMER